MKSGVFIVPLIGKRNRRNWGNREVLGLKHLWKLVKRSRILSQFAHDYFI